MWLCISSLANIFRQSSARFYTWDYPGQTWTHRLQIQISNIQTKNILMNIAENINWKEAFCLKAFWGKFLILDFWRNKVTLVYNFLNASITFDDCWRGDVHPAFTLISNAFLRLHNQIAGRLGSLNPGWAHFKVFNEARKIVSAVGQHITYTQFMDGLLGASNPVSTSGTHSHLPNRRHDSKQMKTAQKEHENYPYFMLLQENARCGCL